jgi:2,5-furandicarboxylate decarboxylase 1
VIEKDLRTYLQRTEEEGELLRIKNEVDPRTKAPALLKKSVERGKALLFQKISGSALTAIGNTMASRQWIEKVLGCGDESIATWFGKRSSTGITPVLVESSPVKEVIEDSVDLYKFPIFTFYEKDGGPYITGGIGILKDPETGKQNAGYYSLQLKGKDRLGLHMIPHTHGFEIFQKRAKLGLPTEMAIAIGLHPIEMLAAATHTPLDEFEVAGALRGEAVELIKCDGIDVDVPAHAEIILEGTILLDEKEPEGPIGDWLGYYALVEDRHVLRVDRITTRKDPIYQSVMAGSAEENLLLSVPRESDVLNAAKKVSSSVTKVSLDPFLPICIIQLNKKIEGESMNVILAALKDVPFINVCIAVDEDVDLYNMNDVMWAVVTRSRLEEDVNIVSDLLGFTRDPFGVYKSKMAIDATYPLEHEEHFQRAKLINPDLDLDDYIEPVIKN